MHHHSPTDLPFNNSSPSSRRRTHHVRAPRYARSVRPAPPTEPPSEGTEVTPLPYSEPYLKPPPLETPPIPGGQLGVPNLPQSQYISPEPIETSTITPPPTTQENDWECHLCDRTMPASLESVHLASYIHHRKGEALKLEQGAAQEKEQRRQGVAREQKEEGERRPDKSRAESRQRGDQKLAKSTYKPPLKDVTPWECSICEVTLKMHLKSFHLASSAHYRNEERRQQEEQHNYEQRRLQEIREQEVQRNEQIQRLGEERKREMRQLELRRQELRREELRREELRQEELRREEVKQEELRREELKREEELRQEELRREELKREEELRQEELRREELRREELRRQEEIRQELLIREEELRQEMRRQEELRRQGELRRLEELRIQEEYQQLEEERRQEQKRKEEEKRQQEVRLRQEMQMEDEKIKKEELHRQEVQLQIDDCQQRTDPALVGESKVPVAPTKPARSETFHQAHGPQNRSHVSTVGNVTVGTNGGLKADILVGMIKAVINGGSVSSTMVKRIWECEVCKRSMPPTSRHSHLAGRKHRERKVRWDEGREEREKLMREQRQKVEEARRKEEEEQEQELLRAEEEKREQEERLEQEKLQKQEKIKKEEQRIAQEKLEQGERRKQEEIKKEEQRIAQEKLEEEERRKQEIEKEKQRIAQEKLEEEERRKQEEIKKEEQRIAREKLEEEERRKQEEIQKEERRVLEEKCIEEERQRLEEKRKEEEGPYQKESVEPRKQQEMHLQEHCKPEPEEQHDVGSPKADTSAAPPPIGSAPQGGNKALMQTGGMYQHGGLPQMWMPGYSMLEGGLAQPMAPPPPPVFQAGQGSGVKYGEATGGPEEKGLRNKMFQYLLSQGEVQEGELGGDTAKMWTVEEMHWEYVVEEPALAQDIARPLPTPVSCVTDLPPILYRVYDETSVSKYSWLGFTAGNPYMPNQASKFAKMVRRHANWSSRGGTPFISVTTSPDAVGWHIAKKKAEGNYNNVMVALIDTAVLLGSCGTNIWKMHDAMDHFGIEPWGCQRRAYDNEYLCALHIPARAIFACCQADYYMDIALLFLKTLEQREKYLVHGPRQLGIMPMCTKERNLQ